MINDHIHKQLCIFCFSPGPFNTIEHIIPESLGNKEYILKGKVCDKCQSYFGRDIEQYVLNKTPIAFWRTYLKIENKKGRIPVADLSKKIKRKRYQNSHQLHDDYSIINTSGRLIEVDIHDDSIFESINDGKKQI